jgi:hypothetical protein
VAGGGLAGPGTALAADCEAWTQTLPANPAGAGGLNALNGVAVVSACDVWVAGYFWPAGGGSQRTLIERWTGGPNWTVVPSPSPGQYPDGSSGSNYLQAVAAVSATDVWAVGYYSDGPETRGLVLHWDGGNWTQVAVPDSSNVLSGISAISDRDIWVAGNDHASQALILHYDGTGWTTYSPGVGAEGAHVSLKGMTATSASDVWVVGSYEARFSLFDNPLTLHWDGSRWSQVPSPALTPPDDPYGTTLTSVSATSPADAWTVGTAGAPAHTAILHWDGNRWTPAPSPDPGGDRGSRLAGVAAVSPDSAFAVGRYDTLNGSRTELHNLVLQWDGHRWAEIPSPQPGTVENFLNGVAAGPAGILWTAGIWSDEDSANYRAAAAEFGVVPNVIGDSRAAAVDAMNGAGLGIEINDVTTPGNGCTASTNGTVIATSPAAGTFTGPPVTMTFCRLPVTVPNVYSYDDGSARAAITDARLVVGSVTKTPNCTLPRGDVVTQGPAGGTMVTLGSSVNLVESTGKQANGKPCIIE